MLPASLPCIRTVTCGRSFTTGRAALCRMSGALSCRSQRLGTASVQCSAKAAVRTSRGLPALKYCDILNRSGRCTLRPVGASKHLLCPPALPRQEQRARISHNGHALEKVTRGPLRMLNRLQHLSALKYSSFAKGDGHAASQGEKGTRDKSKCGT